MLTTNKYTCRILATLLYEHGIRYAVLSPGSRNAPISLAVEAHPGISTYIVADERSAAFMALGMSLAHNITPVALICTSGTALLNYSPAIAEAFYRSIPLIVISADRPVQWIDQDDSQTLHQYGALDNFIKKSYNIPDFTDKDEDLKWFAERSINDALITSLTARQGPVHINIQLNTPLSGTSEYSNIENIRSIEMIKPPSIIDSETIKFLATITSSKRVLIIAGFHQPSYTLDEAAAAIANLPNVAFFAESVANIHTGSVIQNIDRTLTQLTPDIANKYVPDIAITLGGALISRYIKEFLRKYRPQEHWHIGYSITTSDCFMSLTKRIETEDSTFLLQLADAMKIIQTSDTPHYSALWHEMSSLGSESHKSYLTSVSWSDLKVYSILLPSIPAEWNLHLSNGTAIRYAQLFETKHLRSIHCNRGVSGIDGCTSTAIGAACLSSTPTILISGDMSFCYDIGALACRFIPANMRFVVISNGGGSIFRFIPTTRKLPEREKLFAADPQIDIAAVAEAFGLESFTVDSESDLKNILEHFYQVSEKPRLLVIKTPIEESANILINYMKRNQK